MPDNPIPEYVTKAQVDDALRALGISPTGTGLVRIDLDLTHRDPIVVTRNVRDGDRIVATNVRIEVPIHWRENAATVPIEPTGHFDSDKWGE